LSPHSRIIAIGVIHGSGHRVSASLVICGHRALACSGHTGTRVIFPMGIAAWVRGADHEADSASGEKSPFAIDGGPVGADAMT